MAVRYGLILVALSTRTSTQIYVDGKACALNGMLLR